jgi:NtrC-family two-component system sensor histidine kinase KinB
MKVKNKLRLGFGFLFIVVLFFGIVSLFYINQISNSAKVILKDNYKSLSIAREMRTVLDENALPFNEGTLRSFNDLLFKETNNITEPGERQAVQGLQVAFNKLQQKGDILTLQRAEKEARRYLREIETVNMQAIVRKNEKANTSVDEATLFLGLTGTFTFLVLFSFSVNFPSIISKPLNALLEGKNEPKAA